VLLVDFLHETYVKLTRIASATVNRFMFSYFDMTTKVFCAQRQVNYTFV
jgi:hypothetical protein